MAASLIEVLYFAPANPFWSSISESARHLQAAIADHDGYFIHPAFDARPSEIPGPGGPPLGAIRARLGAMCREHPETANTIIQGEMSRVSVRELWGMLQAQRLWPHAPCCVILHDPPHLPDFPPSVRSKKSGGPLGAMVLGLSEWLARHGQQKVMRRFIDRIDCFLCLTRRGAELLGDRYPHLRNRIGVLPAWSMGAAPANLEPNFREATEKVMINVLTSESSPAGLADVIDAMAITNRQLSLSGRAGVRIRGILPGIADPRPIEKKLRERIKKLQIDWLIDLRFGLMSDDLANRFFTDTDILVVPYQEASGYRTSVPFMRSQAWAVTVVAADTGFMRENLRHDVDGCLYEPGQPVALARVLLELLTDPERRLRLARGLRERALGERAPQNVVSLLHEVHEEVLRARREGRAVIMPKAARVFELSAAEEIAAP